MKRKPPTLAEKVTILQRQALCTICHGSLGEGPIEYDHGWALARGGSDEVENLRAVHPECHAIKTRGNGATTRGSDIGEIAKTRRLEKYPDGKPSKHPMRNPNWRKPMRGPAVRR